MLDIQFIRNHPEVVKQNIINRGLDPQEVSCDDFLRLDDEYRQVLRRVEDMRAQKNQLSDRMGELGGQPAPDLLQKARGIKEELQGLEKKLRVLEEKRLRRWRQIPNLASSDVPVGEDESENVEVRRWKEPREFDFPCRDHLEIGEKLGLIDTDRAAKVSGSRFAYLTRELVLLELSLFRYALDVIVEEGFVPVLPPAMIKKEMEANLGYGEHGGWEDMYILKDDGLVLVATSEHSMVSRHVEEVFGREELPLRYVGISSCFRREAGSYGRDTRGILRLHQFNKVEMVSFTPPEDSSQELEYLMNIEERLMQSLELPYRIVQMCTGDLGQPAAVKYDLEAWMPGQNRYRETHSASNCTDYQARRLNIRYRDDNDLNFVHTLNATAFSERPLIAILENYQQDDGSVRVPDVLVPYTGFSEIKR